MKNSTTYLILLVLCLICSGAIAQNSCEDPSVITGNPCIEIYDPVCGCDGNTYSNECFANEAGIIFYTSGECNDGCVDPNFMNPDAICIEIYDPVCGCNGDVYSNSCIAESHGVTAYESGTCDDNHCPYDELFCSTWFRDEISSLSENWSCGIQPDGGTCEFSALLGSYNNEGYVIISGQCVSSEGFIGDGFWKVFDCSGFLIEYCESFSFGFSCNIGDGEFRYMLENITEVYHCSDDLPPCDSPCNVQDSNDLVCMDWLRFLIEESVVNNCPPLSHHFSFHLAYWNNMPVIIGNVAGAPDGGGYDIFDCSGSLLQSARCAIGCIYEPDPPIIDIEDLSNDELIWSCSDGLPCAVNTIDFEHNHMLTIAPNPVLDVLQIVRFGRADRFELIDVKGQVIKKFTNEYLTVPLSDLRAGTYFIRSFEGNEVLSVQKLIKI